MCEDIFSRKLFYGKWKINIFLCVFKKKVWAATKKIRTWKLIQNHLKINLKIIPNPTCEKIPFKINSSIFFFPKNHIQFNMWSHQKPCSRLNFFRLLIPSCWCDSLFMIFRCKYFSAAQNTIKHFHSTRLNPILLPFGVSVGFSCFLLILARA